MHLEYGVSFKVIWKQKTFFSFFLNYNFELTIVCLQTVLTNNTLFCVKLTYFEGFFNGVQIYNNSLK